MFGTIKLYFFILLILGAVGGAGYLYYTDTREFHTFINGTAKEEEERLHIVMGYF